MTPTDPNRPSTAYVLILAARPPFTPDQADRLREQPWPDGTSVTLTRTVGPYDALARISGPLATVATTARTIADLEEVAGTLTLAVVDDPYEGWTVNQAPALDPLRDA